MPSNLRKYKNQIVFYTQLAVIIFIVIVVNLASVGWDISKVNFITYGMATFISLYAKAIATNYASNQELMSVIVFEDGKNVEKNEIVILENSIIATHHQLLNENRTGSFKDATQYRNYKYRLKNEIAIIDAKACKNQKYRIEITEKRKALHELLKALENVDIRLFNNLLEEEHINDHVNIKKMSRKAMKRSNLKMSSLFSTKTSNIEDELDGGDKKITFNKWTYSFKNQALFLIGMPLIQLIFNGMVYDRYAMNKMILIDLAAYIFSITTGLFNGFSIGSDAIRKGYLSKLQERTATIQEILNIEKILLNIKIEDEKREA